MVFLHGRDVSLVMHKVSFGHTGIQIVRISRHSCIIILVLLLFWHTLSDKSAVNSMIIRKDIEDI